MINIHAKFVAIKSNIIIIEHNTYDYKHCTVKKN